MARGRTDILINVFLVLVLAWAVWEARDWPERTRFFPWVIGFPVLALAVINLGATVWRTVRQPREPGSEDVRKKAEEGARADAALLLRRTLTISVWAVVFALGLWLLGFKVGGLLLSPVFLRFQAHESWSTSLLYGLGVYLFFFAGLEMALAFPLPEGFLAASLGLQSFDSYVVNPVLHFFGY